jgi:hypothetical protein
MANNMLAAALTKMALEAALPLCKTRADYLREFVASFTLSALTRYGGMDFKQKVRKECENGKVIRILTEDKGDARGVSHQIDAVPIINVLILINALFGSEGLAELKLAVKDKPKEATLVINMVENIEKLTKGKFHTKNNRYFHISWY